MSRRSTYNDQPQHLGSRQPACRAGQGEHLMAHIRDGKVMLSERDFQGQVLKAAEALGWLSFHAFDSRRSSQGFPDLVLVRPPRLLFVELKSEKGKLSPDQEVWMDRLGRVETAGAGIECYVWRPADFDELARVLR